MANKIEKLTINEIIRILKATPEQDTIDFKRDFNFGKTDDKKSDNIKDIVAIANSITDSPGYIFYGVNHKKDNPLLKISIPDVDHQIQQLVEGKVEPEVKFLFYTVSHKNGQMGIIHIEPNYNKPHIITQNYGKLREGQIFIRKGSTNCGIRHQDLIDIFYDPRNPLFKKSLNLYNSHAKILQSAAKFLELLKADEDEIDEEANRTLGLQ